MQHPSLECRVRAMDDQTLILRLAESPYTELFVLRARDLRDYSPEDRLAVQFAYLFAAAPELFDDLRQIVAGWEAVERGEVAGRSLTDWEQERLDMARSTLGRAAPRSSL